MKFGKHNKYKLFLYSRPVVILLCVLVLLLSKSVYERFGVERDMSLRRSDAEYKLKELQQRRVQIQKRVEYLEGERGIEEEIRKNFDVAREGEQVIILTGESVNESKSNSDTLSTSEKKYWYQFWK